MMKRIILALLGTILSLALAHAQVPSQAAAVGYNTQVFGPKVIVGTTVDSTTSFPKPTATSNWYQFTFFGASWTNVGFVTNSDGSVTLDGTGESGYGAGLTTAIVGTGAPSALSFLGQTFGGGFYAEAVMKGTGPMSFWANDIENMNGASVGIGNPPWPGQPRKVTLCSAAVTCSYTSNGTITTGDVLTLYFVQLNTTIATVTYKVVGGDTFTTIATALKNAIAANGTLSGKSITATSSGQVVTVNTPNTLYPGISILAQTQYPGTETMQVDGYGDWLEPDIAEFDTTGNYGWSFHNWNGTGSDISPVWGGPLNNYNGPPAGVDYTQYHKYGALWVPATNTTPGYMQYYFDGQAISTKMFWNKYDPTLPPPPAVNSATNCVAGPYASNTVCQAAPSSAWSVADTRHFAFILGGSPSNTVTFQSITVWQKDGTGDLPVISTGGTTTKTPVPAPLSGTITAQNWVSYDQSFPGITLACGKPFHFNVLPPAQYTPSNYIYPLYIWLHPDYEGDPWYTGSNTNPLYLTGDEPANYNTPAFLQNYPAFIAAPYADQTNNNSSGCGGDGNDAVKNWGGWFNNGSVGSGTVYSGDTGPNTFALIQMILFLEGQYSIDPNRIYCNGFSLGGIGCEYLMQHYNAYNGDKGKYFAAGASEAGVDQADTPVTSATQTTMLNVPTWYFSGANDTASPPGAYNTPLCSGLGGNPSAQTAITSAAANKCGGSAMRYTLCPTCGHQDTDANGNPVWVNTTINTFLFGQTASGGTVTPPAEAITVASIPTQTSATPFTVSGTISGLTAAPTLQYSVNGGTWLALPTSTGTRNPYNQPGSNMSVWNIPFGNGAIWSNAYHNAICYIGTTTTGACTGYINPVNNFGVTEFTSTVSTDPTFAFSGPNGRTIAPDNGTTLTATMHVPTGAYTPGPYTSGADNQFVLQDQTSFPNRQYTWAGIQPTGVAPPGLQAGQGPFTAAEGAEWDNITSDTYGQDYDTGLSGFNLGTGVINACDVTPSCNPFYPQIKHGLRFMLPPTNFASNATVSGGNILTPSGWPDRLEDYQSGGNIYTGTLPFGYTLGIPSTTAMPSGLDANCQGLFWTMQHYPLIPRDVAGGGFHISMDQTAITSAYGTSAAACLPTLVNLLQVLTNQHQGGQSFSTNPSNGPGARTDTGPLALGSGGTTSVTSTSYFFTEPGMAAGAANTIAIRDVNNTGTFGTSNSFIVTAANTATVGATLSPGFVGTSGSQFRDGSGNNERLACTSYGNPTSNVAGDMTLIRAQGFNCAQVPWFDKVTCPSGTCSFASFDAIVSAANSAGLRIVFTHQGNEGVNGTGACKTQQANGLWYDVNGASPWTASNGTDGCGTSGTVTYAQFKANWLQFANHYTGNTTVIGFDLHNEPTTFGNPGCCATTGGSGTGAFQITNGKIVAPNGNTFIAAGANVYWNATTMAQLCPTSACAKLLADFPGINFLRVVWENGYTQTGMEPYIGYLTALGIVVDICDFNISPGSAPASGSALTSQINWFSGLAGTYKANPYVWYESQNEMYGAGSTMASNQQQLYNAVRAQTTTGIVFLGLPGGGNIGTVGTNGQVNGSGMTPSVYAPMHNIVWDLHFYPYIVNNITGSYSTDIPTIQNVLTGSVAGAYGVTATQSITSGDGIVPVIVGEFGNSTSGSSLDSDGSQLVQATATYTNDSGFASYAIGTYAIGVTCCNALTDGSSNLTSPYGTQMQSLISNAPKGGAGGVSAVGAGWGTSNGGDLKAMTEDVGGALQAADPGVLILVEGVLNNGTLFNGTARGATSFPITAGSISDLSTIGTNPVSCCSGHVGYVVHDTPTGLSGVTPDSGNGATTMRNTAWGYLVTGNTAPIWIGKLGASLDNTNSALTDETAWATGLTQYMNGQLGAQGGPVFTGCSMPLSGNWFSYGNLAGQSPDGTLNADNSYKSGQQTYWSTLLYTTCTNGGTSGIGGTTWNPSDKSSAMALSNGNLTATDTVTEASDSVRSTTSQSAGKVYFEITVTSSSTDWAAGLANSSFPLTLHAGLGGEGNGIGFYNVSPTQYVYYNGAALTTGTTAGATGNVIYFAADLTNKLFWVSSPVMRAASTPWNNSGTASPATGTGGLSFTGLTCPCFITFNDEDAGGAATINAGGPFTGTVPTGFTAFQPSVTNGGRVILLNFAN